MFDLAPDVLLWFVAASNAVSDGLHADLCSMETDFMAAFWSTVTLMCVHNVFVDQWQNITSVENTATLRVIADPLGFLSRRFTHRSCGTLKHVFL